jgi:hypothetical protein
MSRPRRSMDRVLSTAELAALLNLRVGTVREWRRTAKGPPSVTIAGRPGYCVKDVAAWIAARRRTRTLGAAPP